jgi:hypothetical protein
LNIPGIDFLPVLREPPASRNGERLVRRSRLPALTRLAALLLLGLIATPALAEPVSFRLIRDKVVVPVTINGHDTFAFLDTAAVRSGVDSALAKELGLPEGRPAKVVGINGGAVNATLTPDVEVKLAGETTRLEVLVAEDHAANYLNAGVRAMIGHDILSRHVVAIDFDAFTIDLVPAATHTAFPATEPVRLKKLGPNWSLPVDIAGYGRRDALFDLGAEGAMLIVAGSLDHMRLTFGRKTSSAQLFSANGQPAKVTMLSLRRVSLTGAEFDGVPVAVMSVKGSSLGAIAGAGLLSRFNLVIDLSRERLWMTPNQRASLPFRRNVTGLYHGEDMVLDMVAPGSPAKAAGFRPGDRLAAYYDDAGALILDPYEIDAGESVRVILADGREKTFIAAAYY